MNAVMIDLEFLDLKPSAAIMQIGAVVMDMDALTITEELHIDVSAISCIAAGMTVGESTYRWWAGQDLTVLKKHMAIEHTFDDMLEIADATMRVHNFFAAHAPAEIWACGSMDQPIIENAFEATGLALPWRYYDWRDYRTMREEFGHLVIAPDPILPSHNALNDAKWQAQHLLAMKRVLRSTLGGGNY